MTHGPQLVLWDVDGTLLRAGGLASSAFDAAVETVVGRPVGGHGVRFSGKTDPQIAREILAVLDLHEEADGHLPGIVAELERTIGAGRDELRAKGHLLPGVPAVLEALQRAGTVQTVLTGNTAANAAVKVDAFELRPWLDLEVGAFGSDDPDRDALVPVALGRVEARYGPVDRSATWVVGDTPFDARCARAGGVRCLLVATGRGPRSELEAAGADAVMDDLADTAAVLEILAG